MKRSKILIGILSCKRYAERREACLKTWANAERSDGMDFVFVMGDGLHQDPVRQGCLLHCPCPDDYDHLSQKTRVFCHWAVANCDFDFVFKCDDDTYVHVDRLLSCNTPGDYVGGDIPGHDYGHPSGGAGYRLSRNAAAQVGALLNGSVSYEDWLVWKLLTTLGVQFRSDRRFHYNCDLRPARENVQITCHRCSPDVMIQIHDSIYGKQADGPERSL